MCWGRFRCFAIDKPRVLKPCEGRRLSSDELENYFAKAVLYIFPSYLKADGATTLESMITSGHICGIVKKLFLKDHQFFPLEIGTDLLQSGICDSLGLLTLAAELEKEYPFLQIYDQEIQRENFSSVGRILKFLSQKGFDVDKC